MKLSSNAVVVLQLLAGFVLTVHGAGKPRLLVANAVVKLRGTSILDMIFFWFLTFSDCWLGSRLFGAMSTFELLAALESDIARTTEIWLHARIVRLHVYFYNSTASSWTLATPRTTWEWATVFTVGYAMENLARSLKKYATFLSNIFAHFCLDL